MGPDTNPDEAQRRQIEEDFAVVMSIGDASVRADQLIEIAPHLTTDLLDQALTNAKSISDERVRVKAFAGLAPYLNLTQIDEALVLAGDFSVTEFRFEALGAFGRYADATRRAKLILEISNWSDPTTRLHGWLGLIDVLDDDKKQDAFATALNLPDEEERVNALVKLAPALTPTWKMNALASVRSMKSTEAKVRGLCLLIPVLPKREKASAVDEALSLSHALLPVAQAEAVLALLPHLPSDLQDSVVLELADVAVRANPFDRIDVFLQLAKNNQTQPYRARALMSAVEATREIADENQRKDALVNIAAISAPELRSVILKEAEGFDDSRIRSSLLIRLNDIFGPEPEGHTASISEPQLASPPADGIAETTVLTETAGKLPPPPAPIHESVKPNASVETGSQHSGAQASESDKTDAAVETATVASTTRKPRSSKAPRKNVKSAPVQPAPPPPEVFEPFGVKTYLHSDKWTLDDQLNYSLYANAIAEFIRHEDTHPPLAIGILAPWGQGKTTLMKLIQDQLEKKAKGAPPSLPLPPPDAPAAPGAVAPAPNGAAAAPAPAPSNVGPNRMAPPARPRFRFEDLRDWLRDPSYSPSVRTLPYPTVWFNAWKYQNSEQLWAAMAYCILNQLVSQIPDQWERERFWLALQAERIDFAEVRRDIHRAIFESIAPWLILWGGFALIGIMLFALSFALHSGVLSIAGPATFSMSFLACVGQWLWAKMRVHKKPLEGKFAQYVRQPTYEGKLGFFHEVEQDVRRVFKLLVSEKEPVVIFIDDLDRCSPGTVAQVIEAMNLFLSADFPDCYFIVGMDAQVVAASMEVAYENLDRKLKSVTRSYGSLGWYFMDKFIQLQFNIPNMNKEMRNGYLAKLFGHAAASEQKQPTKEELNRIEAEVTATLENKEVKPEDLARTATQVAQLRVERPKVWQIQSRKLIETGAKKLTDDNPELQKYLDDYKDLLGSSPRAIKRFANLFRFYSLTQYARQTQGLEASSPAALARWLVIMLRWPQLVRWIQWESETKLTTETDAKDKAAALEEQLCGTRTFEAWLKHLEEMDPAQGEWLRDKHLYDFLKTPVAIDRKLTIAVQNGVW